MSHANRHAEPPIKNASAPQDACLSGKFTRLELRKAISNFLDFHERTLARENLSKARRLANSTGAQSASTERLRSS